MARAYIVLLREDLPDNFLQTLDLVPNTSQRSFPYTPDGQTHYESFFLLDGVNLAVALTGAGPITVVGDNYGLSSYLVDRIENSGAVGTPALTSAEAVQISGLIEADAAAGNALTAAVIDTHINTPAGVLASGLAVGNSTGTVEEIMRILSGERYKLPANTVVEDGANAYVPGIKGYFVTHPNVEGPGSVRNQYGAVRGRNPFTSGPVVPLTPPVQTGTEDTNFNNIRQIFDTGDLHRSAGSGALAEMKAATFTFINSDYTYNTGVAATDAVTLAGTNIPAGGQAPAVAVYAADGTVI